MDDPRIQELKDLLPRCLLPDWVRLGSRLVRLLRDPQSRGAQNVLLDRLLKEARESNARCERRRQRVPHPSYPPDLPITAARGEIIAAIKANPVLIIAGETGSGKTTQIPKMCLEAGLGIEAMIGCTQPRRVAALSISKRIAEELNVNWGREVGCQIRFDDRSGDDTYIKLMTDGILLAETQGDPLLSAYNALIIDEAHERNLNIDFLLGYVKGLLARRTDLKLVITSATIDTDAFSRAFNNAPILEVSGRMYPVETIYSPVDEAAEENGDLTFIDAAVRATGDILRDSDDGDVLIFMPGERDIRETADMLEGQWRGEVEVIPLFGRLSTGDQQRVFSPASRRKIVIATNIAETSLTIPGIRFVIDSGLARISRYNPRTRTRRLPVEPVSQSSANQRKGRAGRVEAGVCIRLYSEADFSERPPFTQPEIQRANLAEVILRMKAFHLGDIETFPFLNPPSPAAIQTGYTLLQELGALDDARELTDLGRDLARLPIDPTLGRMLLQSQQEHSTRELLIIAAGLSIQDPRERPLEHRDAADAAHKRFADIRSDFLGLLNLWNAVHDEWETLRTQNQRRKFCKSRFLSYLRMREWQDLHAQLTGALDDLGALPRRDEKASYEAIHRSILVGLPAQVSVRTERNQYQTAGNRTVMLFPGSSLFQRPEPARKTASAPKKDSVSTKKPSQPTWIVTGEIVETSQTFARTGAGIDPLWIVELLPHLCKITRTHPHWSATAGRVLVNETLTVHGLEVHRRKASFGNVDSAEATAIFIRSALVEEQLFPRPEDGGDELRHTSSRSPSSRDLLSALPAEERPLPLEFHFLEFNRRILEKIEHWQTRVRHHDLLDPDEALFRFYAARIRECSSLHEFRRLLGGPVPPESLCANEGDLAGDSSLKFDATAFPDSVSIQGQELTLSYAYSPGEEHDGVTVQLPAGLAHCVLPSSLDWAVPGLRAEQITELLRALPKALRRDLMPFPPKVEEIVRDFRPTGPTLLPELARFLRQRYGVEVAASAWSEDALPAHLRPRIEIVGHDRKTLAAGRDLEVLKRKLQSTPVHSQQDSSGWNRAARQWERFGLTGWNFQDHPEHVTLEEPGRPPVQAWPGLALEEKHVNLRLFRTPEAARQAGLPPLHRLLELALHKDLAWTEKDFRILSRFESAFGGPAALSEFQSSALRHLQRHLYPVEPFPRLVAAQFQSTVAAVREKLRTLTPAFLDLLGRILEIRQQIQRKLSAPAAPPGPAKITRTLTDFRQLGLPATPPSPNPLATELDRLVPLYFLDHTPHERLEQLPRYLKALLIRAERAALNPAKDQERMRQLRPYVEALDNVLRAAPGSSAAPEAVSKFRWMIEEFKVSLFAQELGTAVPVSAKRLDQLLDNCR
ncbi:MAG: ATP-dependent RNA helicase HrpA [Pedosphaera sp.]|nr:ATP-dependent RNA helicase HrpA [Pedosphaera sp.]